MTTKPISLIQPAGNTDSFAWSNVLGGSWDTAGNWTDSTLGMQATTVPGAGNAVTIVGATGFEKFLNITDNGSAASLALSNTVLVWGTLGVGGGVTLAGSADVELDGGASITAGSIGAGTSSTLELGGASSLKVSGAVVLNGGTLEAVDGSTAQIGGLIGNNPTTYSSYAPTLAVDETSSLEVGTAGGAAKGAITVDAGTSIAMVGTIEGNLVVDGTLGVQAGGNLGIDNANGGLLATNTTISGPGVLALSQNSYIYLGVADSTSIQFDGPGGEIGMSVLPTGTITGFAAGDVIKMFDLATGIGSVVQTSTTLTTVTLTKAGQIVGTLKLAGNYAGDHFHLSVYPSGNAYLSLQTIGSAPPQPTTILGTVGTDTLTATANNQTLTGSGGGDSYVVTGFTGVTVRDTSANLNGSSLTGFQTSDMVDATDMAPGTATVAYTPYYIAQYTITGTPGSLTITDGTHHATFAIPSALSLPTGYFATATDGAGGTLVTYVTVNTDAYAWSNATGGSFGTAANWRDTTTSAVATTAPSYGNAVTIAGTPSGGMLTEVTGGGFAASLTTSGNVLLTGSVVVGSKITGASGSLTQTGTLDLDHGASLALTGSASIGGSVALGGGSTLTVAGAATFISGSTESLLATNGSRMKLAALTLSSSYSSSFGISDIGVDATSAIEIGTLGGAGTGALTIDAGTLVNLNGAVYGNLVVNGTLDLNGSLVIDGFGTLAPVISGSGTIDLYYGQTLTLAGADGAAIQFNSTSNSNYYSGDVETLLLQGALPTGTILGFAAGEAITVARAITSLSYVQTTTSAGTLKLFSGSTQVGALSLAGSYTAAQFVVQIAPDQRSSTIVYVPTPNSATAVQISTTTDSYTWNASAGGDWSNPANWEDNNNVATTAPGIGNAVTIGNFDFSNTAAIISGTGAAASLNVYAPDIFTGHLSIAGSAAFDSDDSQPVVFSGGASLAAGNLTTEDAGLIVAGASTVRTSSTNTGYSFILGSMTVVGSSSVQLANQNIEIDGSAAVDSTSSIELGSAGGAAAGALTVDAGQSAAFNGTIAAKLVLNGTLVMSNNQYGIANLGVIQAYGGGVGSITGTGTIDITPSEHLLLNATDSAAIAFTTTNPYAYATGASVLELKGPLPTGTITGLITGDIIQIDRPVTGVSFVQTTSSQGVLTLTSGTTTLGTLTLAGSFTGKLFHLDLTPATGATSITVQAATSSAAAGTTGTTPAAHSWSGAAGGSWATASNWTNTGTHTVPGTADAVSIAGSTATGTFTSIGGTGHAASVSITGNVLLTGPVTVAGQLALAPGSGQPATLALDAGAQLTAASAAVTGTLEAEGASTATISGTATLAGGTLTAFGGSTVQLGGLVADGAGNVIAVDATSIIAVGTAAGAANGTLTLSGSTSAALNGSIYGSVAVEGQQYIAAGSSLFIDMAAHAESDPLASSPPSVTGGGVLHVMEGSTLGLGVADSVAIHLDGPDANLELAVLPTHAITGFTSGDQIRIDTTVTGLSYAQTTSTAGTLTLTDGTQVVGKLTLNGNYPAASDDFHLASDSAGGFAVITLQTIGTPPTAPTLISGTAASDILAATANGQTLTGLGGGDTMNGNGFTGLSFKDLTANLNGSALQNFATSDLIDFTDMKWTTASVTYANGQLSASDGTHAAKLTLGFQTTPASGGFTYASDGSGGTKVVWHS